MRQIKKVEPTTCLTLWKQLEYSKALEFLFVDSTKNRILCVEFCRGMKIFKESKCFRKNKAHKFSMKVQRIKAMSLMHLIINCAVSSANFCNQFGAVLVQIEIRLSNDLQN